MGCFDIPEYLLQIIYRTLKLNETNLIFLKFLILMRLLFLSVHQSFSTVVYLLPHERFITLSISVRVTIPKSPRGTECTRRNFPAQVLQRVTLEKYGCLREGKGTVNSGVWFHSLGTLLMYDWSPGKDCPSLQWVARYPETQHCPHRRQAAGKHISLLPIRFLMQTIPGFPSQTATTE